MDAEKLAVKTIARREANPDGGRHLSLWGGLQPPPTWSDYLDEFDEELRPYLVVAGAWLLESHGDDPPLASQWCNDNALQFSDGFTLSFTWRGWGDFVQSVRNQQEGYMKFYC